jgi:superkiller protein 3
MGKYNKAIENFEKSALLDENNFEVFYELGLCHLKEGVPCKAIKCFIRSIQLEPDNPDAIYQLGLAHEMADEADMALMIYQKLIENTPTYLNAYLRKSKLYVKMELYKQALGLYMNALKINPNYTKVYSDIGLCFDKLGKTANAKRYYKKFLCSEPDDENANIILNRVKKMRTVKSADKNLSLV